MTKCPLISYGKQYCAEVECMGEDCILYNCDRDTCLIRLALLKYTEDFTNSEKVNDIRAKLERLENQIIAIKMNFPVTSNIDEDWARLESYYR